MEKQKEEEVRETDRQTDSEADIRNRRMETIPTRSENVGSMPRGTEVRKESDCIVDSGSSMIRMILRSIGKRKHMWERRNTKERERRDQRNRT